jgi:hypothetical protein
MNFIQTLYVDPSKNPFKDGFGWIKPEYHLMSWALSCLQLQKMYGNVELYANNIAADYLVDMLRLPYSSVNTSLDDLKLPDVNLWALPKLYTYSLQEKPFLHVDGDVFIFEKFADSLLQGALIAQNREVATEYYTSTQKQLMENFTYFPTCVKDDFESGIPINAVNAGIFGGNDIDFFQQYTSEAFEYINRNVKHFQSIDVDRFNVFFEQHLFYSMAKKQHKPIQYLFDDIFTDRGYLYLGNFQEVPYDRTYIHLLGHYKRDEITCLQMAAKLREMYPEYYYRIIDLCKKNNVPLFTNFYNTKNVESKDDYQQLINKSIESFEKNNYIDYAVQQQSTPNDSFFNAMCSIYANSPDVTFDVQHFKDDCHSFSEKLRSVMNENSNLSDYYLYGRDLKSVEWYAQVFGNKSNFQLINFVQTKGFYIIESSFNWSGLMNKLYRVGVQYYETLTVEEGIFFNLVVPEIIGGKVLLYDIDELAKAVLELLSEPKKITDILNTLEQYFEDEVIQNHYEAFKKLIEKVIKQLIQYKAIQPLR